MGTILVCIIIALILVLLFQCVIFLDIYEKLSHIFVCVDDDDDIDERK